MKNRAAPLALDHSPDSWEKLQYTPVILSGKWLDKPVFKLANRFYHHQPGYDVYGLFQLQRDNSIVAINRGWVELNRTQPPTLQYPRQGSLTGIVYLPSTGFTLGPATTDDKASLVELQYLDLNVISSIAGHTVEPAVVILKENSLDSLQYHWQPILMSPQRHYAYALQWFALAATWLVFGVIWLKHRKRRSDRLFTPETVD